MTSLKCKKKWGFKMASLLSRIGLGLGQGLQTIGQMGMDEQREKRLMKIREGYRSGAATQQQEFQSGATKQQQEFRSGEAGAQREFAAGENEKDRQSRISLASKKAGEKPDQVLKTAVDEMTGIETITFKSGKQVDYDPESDTSTVRGEGKGKLSEESIAADKDWADKMANREAGTFSGDEADFPVFKSEEKASEAAAQFRNNARKAGTLDDFDTEFAKKGWGYIQELAGGGQSKAAPSKKEAGTNLMEIFKDFDSKDYDGIANQIIKDPNASKQLKDEARDYLSGAS